MAEQSQQTDADFVALLRRSLEDFKLPEDFKAIARHRRGLSIRLEDGGRVGRVTVGRDSLDMLSKEVRIYDQYPVRSLKELNALAVNSWNTRFPAIIYLPGVCSVCGMPVKDKSKASRMPGGVYAYFCDQHSDGGFRF